MDQEKHRYARRVLSNGLRFVDERLVESLVEVDLEELFRLWGNGETGKHLLGFDLREEFANERRQLRSIEHRIEIQRKE